METKDLLPSPTPLETIKGQQGPIQSPEVTYHTTIGGKPTEYNKPPVVHGYSQEGKPVFEQKSGTIIDVKTPDPTSTQD